jgi:hypothetical protein
MHALWNMRCLGNTITINSIRGHQTLAKTADSIERREHITALLEYQPTYREMLSKGREASVDLLVCKRSPISKPAKEKSRPNLLPSDVIAVDPAAMLSVKTVLGQLITELSPFLLGFPLDMHDGLGITLPSCLVVFDGRTDECNL